MCSVPSRINALAEIPLLLFPCLLTQQNPTWTVLNSGPHFHPQDLLLKIVMMVQTQTTFTPPKVVTAAEEKHLFRSDLLPNSPRSLPSIFI